MEIEPITREEILLNAISSGDNAGIKPITRHEMFLARLGGADVNTPKPITRTEMFLQKAIEAGGGKREGTAIPAGERVHTIYFNTNLTAAETSAILSQLTYVQTPLLEYPLYAIYANTPDGDTGAFILALKIAEGSYILQEIMSVSTKKFFTFYVSEYGHMSKINGGFVTHIEQNGEPLYGWLGVNAIRIYADGQALTDFNGIPVGAENDKLKNLLSITPF